MLPEEESDFIPVSMEIPVILEDGMRVLLSNPKVTSEDRQCGEMYRNVQREVSPGCGRLVQLLELTGGKENSKALFYFIFLSANEVS